jgi:alkylhydroperoxidase family enzyme
VVYCLRIRWENRLNLPEHETKIKLIEDKDATGEVAKVYDEWRAKSGRQQMPGILKCFSHRPDFLRQVMQFSDTVHFSQGHLDRRTKEAIASWVSWLNRCPY